MLAGIIWGKDKLGLVSLADDGFILIKNYNHPGLSNILYEHTVYTSLCECVLDDWTNMGFDRFLQIHNIFG